MNAGKDPSWVINAVAPIRICDNGGWTDTWFSQHGAIFNIGVSPYAEVQVQIFGDTGERQRAWLNVENYEDYYAVSLDEADWDRHPLLEASIRHMGVPEGMTVEIAIYSAAPSGASTVTSAAISVAMIGNTEAQARLHPELISRDARRVIEIAKEHEAAGWKVNGTGGKAAL
jgi:D-glycero-alpha-D-manno-heptose-7-phosphate kinase